MGQESSGVLILNGVDDWQILQQNAHSLAELNLKGRWIGESGGRVQVRLVNEASGQPVTAALDRANVETAADGTWSGRVTGIPAGGLYRLETRYNPIHNLAGE